MTTDDSGCTPLMIAAMNGKLECIQFLVSKGASIHTADSLGDNALMFACMTGYADCVHLLLINGGVVDSRANSGRTPLMKAVSNGHLQCAHILIAYGANVNNKDIDGLTSLMYASMYGNLDCIKLLVSNGADVTCQCNEGRTAISYSSMDQKFNESSKFLMNHLEGLRTNNQTKTSVNNLLSTNTSIAGNRNTIDVVSENFQQLVLSDINIEIPVQVAVPIYHNPPQHSSSSPSLLDDGFKIQNAGSSTNHTSVPSSLPVTSINWICIHCNYVNSQGIFCCMCGNRSR